MPPTHGSRILCLALAAVAGCWRAPTSPVSNEAPALVRSVLTTLVDTQRVELARTAPLEPAGRSSPTPLRDAQVTMTGPDGEIAFAESVPGLYVAAFRPQPGTEYRLAIRLADGTVISGRTVVPRPPDLSPVGPTVRIAGREGRLRLVWRPSADAAAYGSSFRDPGMDDIDFTPFGGYTTDTTATLPVITTCTTGCCAPATALVLALDAAFLRYFDVPTAPAAPSRSRLDGAVGVFTAVSGDSVQVVFDGAGPC